jgi:hypothetical protein
MTKKSTEYWIGEFEKSLEELIDNKHDLDPLLYQVRYDSMVSQLASLRQELKTYEDEK